MDILDSLPSTVFEYIRPKLAVFTTPNVEFHILFPNFTTEFRRHFRPEKNSRNGNDLQNIHLFINRVN